MRPGAGRIPARRSRSDERSGSIRRGTHAQQSGRSQQATGNYDKALEYYGRRSRFGARSRDRIGEGDTLNNIGRGYRASKQSEESIRSHQQALSIAREIGDRLGEAAALNDLMLVCRDGKNTPRHLLRRSRSTTGDPRRHQNS
ncbi:MAG: tetratricopeptide repeat protein [Acidobacteria bacterium]|nr:tetratricopeptide repeat protein [Acidobacteriota bacterium]